MLDLPPAVLRRGLFEGVIEFSQSLDGGFGVVLLAGNGRCGERNGDRPFLLVRKSVEAESVGRHFRFSMAGGTSMVNSGGDSGNRIAPVEVQRGAA